MAVYAIYSYEIQEDNRSLFYKETGKKAIEMATEIVSHLLHDGLTVVGKKRKEYKLLTNLNYVGREDVYTWELCNEKDKTLLEGHEKNPVTEHPGCYVIVDNRPDVSQIAIEQNNAFGPDTDKVVKYLKRAFEAHLSEYGLKMVIKRKWQARKFKDIIRERIIENHDAVKKVVWEFPNPDRVKGIDATEQMKERLQGLMLFTQATKALKGKLTLTGSKRNPMDVDDDKIEDWAQIIALSAQNNYKLSYYFYNSSVVNFKDVAYAFATINNKVIRDFETGQLTDNGEGTTFSLIEILDKIRKQIADYDREKIVDDGE
ncbi:MAG: hypothetical protein J6I36_00145 [Bacteroidaceae bacterium]|nr:hypothetical protein [Bacteroidaceae bacterium]